MGESHPFAATLFRGLRRNHYGSALVDPPWAFKAHAPSRNPESDRRVERHYDTMSLAEIRALPVGDYLARDSHLWLWATGPFLPKALDLIEAWGFRYSGSGFVWAKLKAGVADRSLWNPRLEYNFHVGLGFTTRKNVEFCLLARRGNARRIAKDVRELIVAPVREHSRKPEQARERIERYCAGPYLELFGREARRGWTVRGDQMGKFE